MMKIRPFVLIHLLIPALLWSQEDSTFKLNVNVDLTELHVSVTDEKDRPVGSLKMENFHVFEDQTQQKLTVFKHEDIPISLGLVIDNSRSMEPRKQRLDAAALSAVRKSNPEDETFIVHFDDTARLDSDFTNSIPRLEETLASVKPYGQTAIYDALILALDHMQGGRHPKKAILLMTDGVDNSSKHTLAEAIDATRKAQVAVYTVGLLSVSGGQKAEDSLVQIAEANNYGIVREFCGHGIGRSLHEDPPVLNYVQNGKGPKIKPGFVIAIEPMINLGTDKVKVLDDGWTVVTADGKPSAHFEHTIAVTANGPEILTKV